MYGCANTSCATSASGLGREELVAVRVFHVVACRRILATSPTPIFIEHANVFPYRRLISTLI
jgi:hypothetical protein